LSREERGRLVRKSQAELADESSALQQFQISLEIIIAARRSSAKL